VCILLEASFSLGLLVSLQIPREGGRLFRFEACHHSDLKPAASPRARLAAALDGAGEIACGSASTSHLLPQSIEGEQMPAQRLTMRRVRELLRLHYGAGASARAIARELGVSRITVKGYLARAVAAELTWPLPAELGDAVLEEQLFAAGGPKPGTRRRVKPNWAALVREMKRPGSI
jgi:hypothetical protein